MLAGLNHVAVVTDDLDRFVAFYTEVFDLAVAFSESTPAFRHAIVRAGPDSWLHPVQLEDNPHGSAVAGMFERGHLDHLGLTASSIEAFDELRARLDRRGLPPGPVEDLGAFRSFWFEDPDGMQVEVVVIVDPELHGIHEPRPFVLQ
jgi:catechol 2,3-dioxygenase-like lactoylglutathione lyase family enzyme